MQLSAGEFRVLAGRPLVIAGALLASCSHGEPFEVANGGSTEPHNSGSPVQLTYSRVEDQYGAWLPDGSGLIYSYIPEESQSRDRCLGLLPPGGGQRTDSRCSTADAADDSTEAYAFAAPLRAGRVAWLEQHNLRGRTVPDYGAIMLGSLDRRVRPTRLVSLPYTSPAGNIHATITALRWLSPTQLAYIGADLILRAPCMGCKPDTVVVGKEVMLLSPNGGAATGLANSAGTTSLWPFTDGTGFYYTMAGDTRVWRRSLPSGTPELVYDFGSQGIARDVSVVGQRLAAIVGGKVFYGSEPLTGVRQVDSGGVLITVDLTSSSEQAFPLGDTRFRHAELSPDGRAIVAEGVSPGNPNPDLWLFRLP